MLFYTGLNLDDDEFTGRFIDLFIHLFIFY